MAALGGFFKKAVDKVAEPAVGLEQKLDDQSGNNWNVMKTVNEEATNPGSGISTAFKSLGNDASDAYHTSIVNPGHKLGSDFQNLVDKIGAHVGKPALTVPEVTTPQLAGGGVGVPGYPGGGTGGAPGTIGGANPYSDIQIANVAGPQAATINTIPANQFRDQQMALAQQLAGQASGQGPSVAENQFRQAQQANLAATLAQANSQRGGYNPAVARQAMQTNAEVTGQMAQQAATARMQEQMQAAGLLGTVSGQGRASDQEVANQQAQLQQQATLAGYQGQSTQALEQAKLQQAQQAGNADVNKAFAQLQAQYASMGLDAQKANQQAALETQKLIQAGILGAGAINIGQQNAVIGALLGAGGTALGAAGSLSDARAKEDVHPGESKIKNFLDTLTVNDYKYKDEKHGKGRFVSVMAQDLLKTDLGKSMVVDTEDGLGVDYGKGFGALLAAQATLNKRLDALEKKKGKK